MNTFDEYIGCYKKGLVTPLNDCNVIADPLNYGSVWYSGPLLNSVNQSEFPNLLKIVFRVRDP